MRASIKNVRFMRLYTKCLGYRWKCVVYYDSGRVVEYKERIPAPVVHYLRENKFVPADNWTRERLAECGIV